MYTFHSVSRDKFLLNEVLHFILFIPQNLDDSDFMEAGVYLPGTSTLNLVFSWPPDF